VEAKADAVRHEKRYGRHHCEDGREQPGLPLNSWSSSSSKNVSHVEVVSVELGASDELPMHK
jgi:hypothetical protein